MDILGQTWLLSYKMKVFFWKFFSSLYVHVHANYQIDLFFSSRDTTASWILFIFGYNLITNISIDDRNKTDIQKPYLNNDKKIMFPKNLYPSVTHDLQMPFKSNDQILRTLSNRRIDTQTAWMMDAIPQDPPVSQASIRTFILFQERIGKENFQ